MHYAKCNFPRQHRSRSYVLAARAAGEHTGHRKPRTALRLYGVNQISPLRGERFSPKHLEIRRGAEVARRLAIFAVKKLCRFEREETRAVRSNVNEVSGASFRVLARNGQF